jgi:hypothetical protein
MRFTYSVMIVLALAGSGPAFAVDKTTIKEARSIYAHCTCHFGYGNACSPSVTCLTEGGRCSGQCTPPREQE